MGVHHAFRRQLASAHLAFVDGGRASFWARCMGAASHERISARAQRGVTVSAVAAAYRETMAERSRRRVVCVASDARRIRRLDRGTEGRAQHLFWIPGAPRVREMPGQKIRNSKLEIRNNFQRVSSQ